MSVYESPIYLNFNDAEKAAFKVLWEQRDPYYEENFERETKSRVYFTGGEWCPRDRLLGKLIPHFAGTKEYIELRSSEERAVRAYFSDRQLKIWNAARKARLDLERKEKKKSTDKLAFNPLKWSVFKNISDIDEMFSVFMPGTGQAVPVNDVDPRAIIEERERVFEGLEDDAKEKYRPGLAKLLYLPWQTDEERQKRSYTLVEMDGINQRVELLNTFEQSPWQKSGGLLPESKAQLPKAFREFFDHLFKDEESKQAVFAWMYRMIFGEDGSSNEVALVLNGAKGIGKNMFADICKGLVGSTNFRTAKRSIMNSDFNLDLKDCLCFFLDEIPVKTQEQCSKFRAYMNDELQLEGKGLESKEYKTYKSFVLNNNPPHEVKVAWDDRRYSVPDLTHNMLNRRWPVKKVAIFDKYIKQFDGLHYRHFASWLYYNADTETYPITYCHKGERFAQMVMASLTPWQATLRRELMDCKKKADFQKSGTTLEGIKNACPSKDTWPIETSTIQAFLESYIEKDERLGFLEIVQVEDVHEAGKFTEDVMLFPPHYGEDILLEMED